MSMPREEYRSVASPYFSSAEMNSSGSSATSPGRSSGMMPS